MTPHAAMDTRTLVSTPGQPRTVLGLDPGMKFGWAVLHAGPMGFVSVIDSGVERLKKGDSEAHRFVHASRWLAELLGLYNPLCVAYELPRRHLGTKAAHIYGGLRGQILVSAGKRDLVTLPIEVGTAKKRATGDGSAGKPAMIEAASPFLDHPPATDDEADALFVALCGCDEAAAWRPDVPVRADR